MAIQYGSVTKGSVGNAAPYQGPNVSPTGPQIPNNFPNRSSYFSTGGQVLGASTSAEGSGGSSNNSSSSSQSSGGGQPPMESAPQQPSVNWDEIYAPAFDALNQAESAQQSSYQQGLGQVQSDYQNQTTDLANEQKSRLADYQGQKDTETGRTQGAIADARRMASQLLQGLQSQYGGSTGTGQFRGEQLGAAATQNINNNKVALQTALTGISNSENALKDKVIGIQKTLDSDLQNNKLQLRAELDKALSSIAQARGGLSVDKGARRQDALSQYQQQLQAVEARNTAFKQQLYVTAQQHAQQLNQLKQSAQDKYQANLQMANLTNGQQFNVGDQTYQVAPDNGGQIQFLKGSNRLDPNAENLDAPITF